VRRAIVGLGSNSDPRIQLARARGALAAEFACVALSSERETTASGGGAGCYLNQLVVLETTLEADELAARLKQLEADLGRVRSPGAPVAIDLDLLALDGRVVSEELHSAWYWRAHRSELGV